MFKLNTLFARFGPVWFGLPITNILSVKFGRSFFSFVPSMSGLIHCCVGSLVGDGFVGLLHLLLLHSINVLLSCQNSEVSRTTLPCSDPQSSRISLSSFSKRRQRKRKQRYVRKIFTCQINALRIFCVRRKNSSNGRW